MEWVEGIGDSIEDAKEMAFVALGVHEDDAEFEVISDARIGLFNRVKEKARIRARVRPATPRSRDDRRRRRGKSGGGNGSGNRKGNRSGGKDGGSEKSDSKSGQGADNSGGGNGSRNSKKGSRGGSGNEKKKSERSQGAAQMSRDDNMETMTLPEQADMAESFVTDLAERFGESVSFERIDVDENEIRIIVSGENLGRMIGRRGSTANAIDELVRTVLQRRAGSGRDGRIRVDLGGVAGRREDALRAFCAQVAEKVRETGVEVALEPMRGADRKVVHDALSSEDGVGTISEGEDPNRRVVVIPSGNDD